MPFKDSGIGGMARGVQTVQQLAVSFPISGPVKIEIGKKLVGVAGFGVWIIRH
jgi:hypothetical protein